MRTAILHLDDALRPQARLREAVRAGGGGEIDCRDLGPALRLWSRPPPLRALSDRLERALPTQAGPALVFAGSGDFHHVTPILVARALEAAGEPTVTVLHFDNHPDWVRFGPGAHCGSWVGQAARLPHVAKVVTVGVCSGDVGRAASRQADLAIVTAGKLDLFTYGAPRSAPEYAIAGRSWPTIEGLGEATFARYLPSRITTEAVYVTIDKDVLRPEDAGTNWDQGRTTAEFLGELIKAATAGRRLIGADVVGDWSRPRYGGDFASVLLKRGEALLDQPRRAPAATARARNEDVNLALLDLLLERAG